LNGKFDFSAFVEQVAKTNKESARLQAKTVQYFISNGKGLHSYVYVGKTSAAWDSVLRLVERNLHHPRTLVALTRFATHWQELGA